MPEPTSCCRCVGDYCDRCDLLVGLEGLHVVGVERDDGGATPAAWRWSRAVVSPMPNSPANSAVERPAL